MVHDIWRLCIRGARAARQTFTTSGAARRMVRDVWRLALGDVTIRGSRAARGMFTRSAAARRSWVWGGEAFVAVRVVWGCHWGLLG
ncbi:hypothetical protein TIFTF001_029139 [Ficus carica]|uniref:Uncharacterized protein n=1 Tax=Ficus carica TaxID=3494 RepID=A0AA88DV95_FICCA|nr:hypothetical protein TIFTF001_029139 [Ficus carica]